VFTGHVLSDSRGKRVSEEESGDPVALRMAFVDPFLEESATVLEIRDVSAYWLTALIRLITPKLRHLAVKEILSRHFELSTHHH